MIPWEPNPANAVVPQAPDESLLDRVRDGEVAVYGILMNRHQRRLHSVALRILDNPADAEEAVQNAHLRVLTRIDQFGGRSSFLTYLNRIVINEALSRRRSQARCPVVSMDCIPDAAGRLRSHDVNPEQQAIDHELSDSLRSAMNALPEVYRVAFRMKEIDELSVAEIAARLGVTPECAKTRIHRARVLLRRHMRSRCRPEKLCA